VAQGVRVIVFNADEEYQSSLRSELLSIEGVKIIAEVNDSALLPIALQQYPCDVVLVHLDPSPEMYLDVAIQVAASNADRPVFALSECTEGQLILAAMRGGLREFLTKPLDRNHLAESLGRVLQNAPSRKSQGRLYAFMGTMGGVGATTLATNVAVELADLHDGKVALVDLDFRFGQVATLLDIQPNFTIADLCHTPEMLEPSLIEKVMVQHDTGVYVLARPNSFHQANSITAAHCASVLTALQEQYDYVVVDGPNRFDSGGQVVLNMADITFLIIQLIVTSVRSVHRILEEMHSEGYNQSLVKLICNRAGGKETGDLAPEHIEKTLSRPIFWSIADDWKSVASMINMGQPLLTIAPKTRVRQTIRELAERLMSHDEIEEDQPRPVKKGGGLFSKIFSDG
jgi:pilus assembly protein CpaE